MKQKNIEIGKKIWDRRTQLGISRRELAGKLKISQQQLEKYEKGQNRISVATVLLISEYTKTPIEYFIEQETVFSDDVIQNNRQCLELARNFVKIKEEKHRRLVMMASKILSSQET